MRYNPSRLRIMDEDDFLDATALLNSEVSTFTENYILDHSKAPDLDDFIETHPLYDHEILYPQIRKELARITDLVQKELAE
jgi:hypothetical protein